SARTRSRMEECRWGFKEIGRNESESGAAFGPGTTHTLGENGGFSKAGRWKTTLRRPTRRRDGGASLPLSPLRRLRLGGLLHQEVVAHRREGEEEHARHL